MKIGLIGGSFDPVHYGHLLLAERCREECQLDEVRFVPAATAPHKQAGGRATGEHRMQMLKLATSGHAAMVPWDVELQRGGISFTVDTIRELRHECPQDELYFLVGADTLHDLPNWREPTEICELATIVAVHRPGSPNADLSVLNRVTSQTRIERFAQHIVQMPQLDLSSTEIRNRVATDRSIRFQLPRAVEQFIIENGLYHEEKNATH